MADVTWNKMCTRIMGGVGILALALNSVAPAALAQSESDARIDQLRALAEAARASTSAAEEKTRLQLSTLNQRLEETAAQNELILQMMGQLITTQAGGSIAEQVDTKIAGAEAEAATVAQAAASLAAVAQSEAEKALAEATAQFETILAQVPSKADLSKWSQQEIERINAEIEKAKKAADKALDDYVERDLIPQINEACSGSTAYQQRLLVTQARNGADDASIGATLQGIGCNEASDLVRKLSQARTAEEAQAAFQSSMQSMMMAAMMSGNPYVAAIAAVLMLLAAIFADGNGDGDGDGVDDQPGGGPIKGAPAPGNAPVADTESDGQPTPEPVQATPPNDTVVSVADEPIDPRDRNQILAARGNPDVNAHPGVGCEYNILLGNEKLTLAKPNDSNVLFDIDLTAVQGTKPYTNFPLDWTDDRLRLISCDFTLGEEAVIIQYDTGSGADPQCLKIARESGEGWNFRLTDTGFVIGENRLCSKG